MSTKYRLGTFVFAMLLAVGCGRSTVEEAEEHAAKISEATNAAAPESIPPGCYMRAVINGEKWEATAMTPDVSIPSIVSVNGRKEGSLITFTISGKPDNVGTPRDLSDMYTITYWGSNDDIFGAKSGQTTVRKLDDQFLEGTFHFTAEQNGKKITCTDGEFRIPSPTSKAAN